MSKAIAVQKAISVVEQKGQAITSSRNVAEIFNKKHQHVMEAIRRILERYDGVRENFILTNYIDSQNKRQPEYLITEEGKKFLDNKFGMGMRAKRLEKNFETLLSELLSGVAVFEKQFKVSDYRIDFYFPTLKLAVEYDEKEHIKRRDRDIQRQSEISQKLNCSFVRVKEGYETKGINEIFKFIISHKYKAEDSASISHHNN